MKIMNSTSIETLNSQLLRRPEPVRENLARYISEHLDEIENEMQYSDEPISDELRAELELREAEYELKPNEGVSWDDLKKRLLTPR